MTTLAKRVVIHSNAMKSTGSKTSAGKVLAKTNALSHGLRAASPTVPGEDVEAWEEFRDGIVSDLALVGFLETELADRVALLSWRLDRHRLGRGNLLVHFAKPGEDRELF